MFLLKIPEVSFEFTCKYKSINQSLKQNKTKTVALYWLRINNSEMTHSSEAWHITQDQSDTTLLLLTPCFSNSLKFQQKSHTEWNVYLSSEKFHLQSVCYIVNQLFTVYWSQGMMLNTAATCIYVDDNIVYWINKRDNSKVTRCYLPSIWHPLTLFIGLPY